MSIVRLSQDEFKAISFQVMEHVFAIHNKFGRFFDERVYKLELQSRMPGVQLEVGIELNHRSFSKTLFVDSIVHGGAMFEFKAVEAIHPRHRAQCIQYLLLLGLAHGKLINVRSEKVQHEFVNCQTRLIDSRSPRIQEVDWNAGIAGAEAFQCNLLSVVRDWGCGLTVSLYEEAVTHFLTTESTGLIKVPVYGQRGLIAHQPLRLAAPDVAFKVTAFKKRDCAFVSHASRLIQHTQLTAIHWANIESEQITFTTIV